jgi:hypothetical protein
MALSSAPAARVSPRSAAVRRRGNLHCRRAPRPPCAAAGLLGGLLDAAAAANAEALARREGRELVGKARGVGALTAVPTSLLERKPASCASALSGLGCLGVTELGCVQRGGPAL